MKRLALVLLLGLLLAATSWARDQPPDDTTAVADEVVLAAVTDATSDLISPTASECSNLMRSENADNRSPDPLMKMTTDKEQTTLVCTKPVANTNASNTLKDPETRLVQVQSKIVPAMNHWYVATSTHLTV